jgi:hypothetical protein
VFTTLSPESGLLQVLASIFFLLLLLNTLAAQPTRARAMQSLGVVLLSAFVLKYVVLDALYAPEGSLARKVVTTLIEGVSLGALGYTPHGPATAYVAFVVVLAYLFALVLLPGNETATTAGPMTAGPATVGPALRAGRLPAVTATPASDERLAPPRPDDR